LRRGSHHHHCHEEVRKEGRIPYACAAQTETALFFIKASAAKAEILVGLKSEFLPGDHHGRRRRRRRVMRVWQIGGFCERGFLLFIGFVVFLSPDEETLKKKKMKRNQVKTGGQTMLAERMASTKKIAATNYSCWYGEREREIFKNSHHENQSPNSTLFFLFFFPVFHGFRDLIHSCCLTDIGTYSPCLIIFSLKNTSKIC
jgi:hypothetical protein